MRAAWRSALLRQATGPVSDGGVLGSAIPTTREDLKASLSDAYAKLRDDIDRGGAALARTLSVDDWTVKQVLAIRAWWTDAVVRWIEAGRAGEPFEVPAPGFGWNETPRLNAGIAAAADESEWTAVLQRLDEGYRSVNATIDSLDDRELLEPGAFEWAGKWPIARWISINTTRQYTTARTYIRRALRDAGASGNT